MARPQLIRHADRPQPRPAHLRARAWLALALAIAAGGCDATSSDAASSAVRCLSDEVAQIEGPASSECDWPQAGRSPRRTNYNDGEAILSPATVGDLVEAWVTPIGYDPAPDDLARPVVWRGSVFVTAGPELVSLDAATGEQRWRFESLVDLWLHAPAVGSGRVHATNYDALFGIDADTGAELWRAPPPAADYFVAAPLLSGDAIYVNAHEIADPQDAGLWAISAATGAWQWISAVCCTTQARRPATADGLLYSGMPGSDLSAWQIEDGADEWNYAFADGQVGSPAVSRGIVVVPWLQCCAELAQAINAFDAESGELLWTTDLSCTLPLDFSPVIDGSRVYTACDAPGGGVEVLAMSLETGAVEMDVTVGDGALSGELSGANGVLYVGSTDGFLRALNASTGAELLAIELGAPMSQPVIASGRLIVGAGNNVHAFALAD
jgi:outer membrane protein assembly factor BamB